MGIVYAEIRLSNPVRPDLEEVTVMAVVDSGAIDLVVTEHLAAQLHLAELRPRQVRLADGSSLRVRYVGPVKVETQGRDCTTSAYVLGEQILLGAIPMQAMDMIIHPRDHRLVPNPEHPDLPDAMILAA